MHVLLVQVAQGLLLLCPLGSCCLQAKQRQLLVLCREPERVAQLVNRVTERAGELRQLIQPVRPGLTGNQPRRMTGVQLGSKYTSLQVRG